MSVSSDRPVFVTALSDDFVPGFFVLWHSVLEKHANIEMEIRILHHPEWSPLSMGWQGLLTKIFRNLIFVEVDDPVFLEMAKANAEIIGERERLLGAFIKLYLFSFYDAAQIIFLDADMVCVDRLDKLFFPRAGFAACAGNDLRKTCPFVFVNTGVMVIGRDFLNQNFYTKLLKFRLSGNMDGRVGPADQAVINYLIPIDKTELLDDCYNVTKRLLGNGVYDENWERLKPAIVHYVSHKPWHSTSAELCYDRVNGLWWSHYDRYLATIAEREGFLTRLATITSGSVERISKGARISCGQDIHEGQRLLSKCTSMTPGAWSLARRFIGLRYKKYFIKKQPSLFASQCSGRLAIATLVHDDTIESAEVLLASIKANNPGLEFDFVVMATASLGGGRLDGLSYLHPRVIHHVFDPKKYDDISAGSGLGGKAFHMLEVFEVEGYDRIVYLAAEMLCLGAVCGILNIKEGIGAVVDVSRGLCVQQGAMERPMVDPSVLVIGPEYLNKDVGYKLLKRAAGLAGTSGSLDGAEILRQAINAHFKSRPISVLPMNYNAAIGAVGRIPKKYRDHIWLIRYGSLKPRHYLYVDRESVQADKVEKQLLEKWGEFNKRIRLELQRDSYMRAGEYQKWQTLRGTRSGRRCFILGDGPYPQKMDLGKLHSEFVIASGWAGQRDEYDIIRPDLYAISSSGFFGGCRAPEGRLNMKYHRMLLGAARHTPKVFPYSFKHYLESGHHFDGHQLYYLMHEKPISKGIVEAGGLQFDPREPAVDGVLDAITFPLMIAVYMGFDEVYMLGCSQGGADSHISSAYQIAVRSCREAGVAVYNVTNVAEGASGGVSGGVLPQVAYESLF